MILQFLLSFYFTMAYDICTSKNHLTLMQADRDRDTGQYTIRLTCEAGTFEASAYVNVLDVPLKPRNLNPEEVRAEHVKLSWDPPQDDGGTPITGYLVRYMDIDSGEWATACTTSSCNATAKGLKPGHLYQFEVSAINKEGQSEPILTTDPILAENPYSMFLSIMINYYNYPKKMSNRDSK